MSGYLDANIPLRYLTGDPPELAAQAARVIDGEEELWLTDGAIAEIAYVLIGNYGVPRAQAVDALVGLIQRENIRLYAMEKSLVVQALSFCRPSGRVSFADALLWACVRSSGVHRMYTLDVRFPTLGVELRPEP
ncbi:MAG TPA: PIN domain-containing protein [Chloroflexota bacterium]|nr:PIN domain-containing protein [Chloroflexota bacterium]